MPHDAFVSYSSKDKPIADGVVAALEANGIRCWVAPRDVTPGKDWGEAIMDAIGSARAMVLVFSSHANDSAQVKREVQAAFDKGLTVVPLRVEDVVPAKALAYYLSPVHWLDAIPVSDENMNRLVRIVRQCVAAAGGTPAALPAVDYQPTMTSRRGRRWAWPATAAVIVVALGLLAVFFRHAKRGLFPAPMKVAAVASPTATGAPTPGAPTSAPSQGVPSSATPTESEIAVDEIFQDVARLDTDLGVVRKVMASEVSADSYQAVNAVHSPMGFLSVGGVQATTRGSINGLHVSNRTASLGSLGAKPDDVRALADELFTVDQAEDDLMSRIGVKINLGQTLNLAGELGYGGPEDKETSAFFDRDLANAGDRVDASCSLAYLRALRVIRSIPSSLPPDVPGRLAAIKNLSPTSLPTDAELTDLERRVGERYGQVNAAREVLAGQRDGNWNRAIDRWSARLQPPFRLGGRTFESLDQLVQRLGAGPNPPEKTDSSSLLADRIANSRMEGWKDVCVASAFTYATLFDEIDPGAEDYARASAQFTLQYFRFAGKGGLYVATVEAGPGRDAGLHVGDVIVNYDGKPLAKADDLTAARKDVPEGEPVKVEFLRRDEKGLFRRKTATLAHGGALGVALIRI